MSVRMLGNTQDWIPAFTGMTLRKQNSTLVCAKMTVGIQDGLPTVVELGNIQRQKKENV